MTSVGVMVVDHDESTLRATRTVVSGTPGFECLSEARSAEEALEGALQLRPRLAIVAAHMPAIDGPETARFLVSALPGIVVVLLRRNGDSAVEAGGAAAIVPAGALTQSYLRRLWRRHGGARSS